MRHWEIETVAALGAEVDNKQRQVEGLAEAMLTLANHYAKEGRTPISADEVAYEIRETVKEALGA